MGRKTMKTIQMKLYYRNNNAEFYKLFHISVTCGRKQKRDTYLRDVQHSICDGKSVKDIISNKYDHQNLVIACLSFFILHYP